jgi:hypothetical protein
MLFPRPCEHPQRQDQFCTWLVRFWICTSAVPRYPIFYPSATRFCRPKPRDIDCWIPNSSTGRCRSSCNIGRERASLSKWHWPCLCNIWYVMSLLYSITCVLMSRSVGQCPTCNGIQIRNLRVIRFPLSLFIVTFLYRYYFVTPSIPCSPRSMDPGWDPPLSMRLPA